MKPWWHLIITLIALFFYHPSLEFTIAFFLAGVFIDIDHVFDYFLFVKRRKSLRHFLFEDWCKESKKVVLIFHGYEVILILFILIKIFQFQWLNGLFYGSLLHLFLDVIFNVYVSKNGNKNPLVYSIIYRWFLDFDTRKIKNKK